MPGLQINVLKVKPVLNGHSQKDLKLIFKTDYHLLQVKSIAECSKESHSAILSTSLSYHLSIGSLFCLFLSGCFTQVFTVIKKNKICCGL